MSMGKCSNCGAIFDGEECDVCPLPDSRIEQPRSEKASNDRKNAAKTTTLHDLALAKVTFQQKTILAVLSEGKDKDDG